MSDSPIVWCRISVLQEIADACDGWLRMLESWRALPIGGTLELVWPEPDRARGTRRR